MNWKVAFSFVLLIVIALNSKLSHAEQELADEDIEETSELVVNYIGPLLELNGFTLEDFPNQLKFLTAKYYLIFSRGVEPLETLEKMVSDYEIIQKSQHKVAEDFQEYVEHFIKINASNNKKALKNLVTKVLQSFNFDLQVVKPRDAIKFLLYQEAYPDIMKILSLMVRKHHDAYLEVRAKENKHSAQPSNDTDPPQPSSNADDNSVRAMVREFVASHGRLELVKRLVTHLETYIPPVDRENVDESILDYLDELQEFLEAKSNSIWRFVKGPRYAGITDIWIALAEKLYSDFSTVVPLQEILNIFDAVVLNLNDRRALMILRSEVPTIKNDNLSNRVTNARDIFNFICGTAVNDFTAIHDILLTTATKASSEKFSEAIFLEYMDKILAPHDISTNDLSKEMISIISRTFARINSIDGPPPTRVLTADMQLFRKSLQKLRDTISILIPEQSDSNHIELQTLLQSIVNKFGAFVSQQESELVQFFNGVLGNLEEKEKFKEDLSNFEQKIEIGFKNIPIKPSEFLKEKLFEVVEMIDVFINFTSF